MRSGTVRRCAFAAVLALLAPLWARSGPVPPALGGTASVIVRAGAAGATDVLDAVTPLPAVRRHVAGGWAAGGARAEHGRALVALALVALLSLLHPLPWARLRAGRSAASSLVRRRYAIVLRAPPVPACT